MVEKVPENAEAERVLERMIAQGCKLIFATSYGYLEPVLKVAVRHPDVIFMQSGRPETAKNVGCFLDVNHEPMYLAGIVAGRITKTNKLGFVAAQPVVSIIRAINAFALGARSVNSKAETKVVWINSWSDQVLEAEATKGLAESGVDVIGDCQDNQITILRTCEDHGLYSVGFYSDGHQFAPKGWLTGACLEWGPSYLKVVNSVRTHTWKPEVLACGMNTGCSKLCSFGKIVPTSVVKEVHAKEALLKNGEFNIFAGPLKDRERKQRVAPGDKLDTKELASMNWFVAGVTGPLPKK